MTITLGIFGKVSSNLVGFMYANDDGSLIKISYIDFWGKRKNLESALEEIIPPSESSEKSFRFYIPITFYSTKNRLKILHTFGQITDFQQFARIFGDQR